MKGMAELTAAELSARPIEAPGVEAVIRADLARVSALRVNGRGRN